MASFFRAVAIDYDGTLAADNVPDPGTLEALQRFREGCRKAVLVTGRIMEDLRAEFPEVDRHFDAIVAENGAVVVVPGHPERPLAPAVPDDLEAALKRRRVPLRRGKVLLATWVAHDRDVLQEVARLGIDSQIIRNRGALMVLPAGVSKGTGLADVLAELGVSRHSTVAIGDAENDHSLLLACELGVAVANAVPSLQATADVVLAAPDGAGVAAFLDGPVLRGDVLVQPLRWRAQIGVREDGTPAGISGSGTNVLIAGATGTGKSYVAGLIAEQLIALGYALCIFDPEGDHASLAQLRGVLMLGGTRPPPAPEELGSLLRNRFTSVVLDLSLLSAEEKKAYFSLAMDELGRVRRTAGLPHWIFLEEADQLLGGTGLPKGDDRLPPHGFCAVTYRPDRLAQAVLDEMDVFIALAGAESITALASRRIGVPETASAANDESTSAPDVFSLSPNQALLVDRDGVHRITLAARQRPHVRHWRKYVSAEMTPARRFYFRSAGVPNGRTAGNMSDFHREMRRAPADVVAHHLRSGDFSRWIEEVLGDLELGRRIHSIERWFQTDLHPDLRAGRRAVLRAIETRYGDVD